MVNQRKSMTPKRLSRLFDSHFEEGRRNPRLVGDFALVLAFKERIQFLVKVRRPALCSAAAKAFIV
jgi:hypothetical protein